MCLKCLNKRILVTMMFLVMLLSVLPCTRTASGAKQPQSSDFDVIFNDREAVIDMYYFYIPYAPEFIDGERITVTDNGISKEYKYYINDFYDKNRESLADHGFEIRSQWVDPNTGDEMMDLDTVIGKSFDMRFYIYRIDGRGYPLDANGEPIRYRITNKGVPLDSEGNKVLTNDLTDEEYYALLEDIDQELEKVDRRYSAKITYHATDIYRHAKVNGINYLLADGKNHVDYNYPDEDTVLKGTFKIPETVTIEGRSYPVVTLSNVLLANQRITAVKIPQTLRIIENDVFVNTGLKRVKIPSSVKMIGSHAFGFNYKDYTYTKVAGFTIYAKYDSAGADYAIDNGFKLIDERVSKKMRVASFKARALKGKKVRLTWKKKTYPNGFQIYKAKKKNGKYVKVATVKQSAPAKWTSKRFKVRSGKKLFFKIRTFTTVDGKMIYGKWSKIKVVKIRR